MTFDEYQAAALKTSRKPDQKDELFHLVLGLVGEAGEIAEKFKKLVRDHDSQEAAIDKKDITKELGDVLWYCAVLANYLGVSFDEVAKINVAKINDRQARGKLGGSGDNR